MLIIGAVVLVICLVVIVLGLFTARDSSDTGELASIAGLEVGAPAIFGIGLIAGLLLVPALSLVRFGSVRSYQHMRERRRLAGAAKKQNKVDDTSESDQPES